MTTPAAGQPPHRSCPATPAGTMRAARRAFLRCLGSMLGALTLAGCEGAPPGPSVDVALDSIPDGGRLRAMLGDEPVELRRDGSAVSARSLLCTHMGCELQWDGVTGVYDCPCHEGRFSADGRVLGGPPLEPLRQLPVRVEAGRVVVSEGEVG